MYDFLQLPAPTLLKARGLLQIRVKASDGLVPSQLPQGWECRVTRDGKLFYVNHAAKTTHWTPPVSTAIIVLQPELQHQNRPPTPPTRTTSLSTGPSPTAFARGEKLLASTTSQQQRILSPPTQTECPLTRIIPSSHHDTMQASPPADAFACLHAATTQPLPPHAKVAQTSPVGALAVVVDTVLTREEAAMQPSWLKPVRRQPTPTSPRHLGLASPNSSSSDPIRTSTSAQRPLSTLPPQPTALTTPDRRRSVPSLVRYQPSCDPRSPDARLAAKRCSSGEDLTPLAKRPLRNLSDGDPNICGRLAPPLVDTAPVSPKPLPTTLHYEAPTHGPSPTSRLGSSPQRRLSAVPEEDEPPCTPPAVSVCPFECQTPSRGHRIPHVTDEEVRSNCLETLLSVADKAQA